jgi:SAM-dependent methyltransferase
LVTRSGIQYFGSDLHEGKHVDFIVDFEQREQVQATFNGRTFGSILILNVLEHVFDPIRILDNAFSILRPSGACIIITPAVWPLHDYPLDCWRIMPSFYDTYCKRRKLKLTSLEYVGRGDVKDFADSDRNYHLPLPSQNKTRMIYSRIVHKLFNTPARLMLFPSHVSIGAVIEKC